MTLYFVQLVDVTDSVGVPSSRSKLKKSRCGL